MAWLVPAILFVLSVVFWRLSFRATDAVVAWCRFIAALFVLLLTAVYAVALLLS